MELFQVEHEINVIHNGKYDHKQGVEDKEIHEIPNHLTHYLDELTDF